MKKRSLENISQLPVISDINDYQTVHLVGLSFTRSWCMKILPKFYQKIIDTKTFRRNFCQIFRKCFAIWFQRKLWWRSLVG